MKKYEKKTQDTARNYLLKNIKKSRITMSNNIKNTQSSQRFTHGNLEIKNATYINLPN